MRANMVNFNNASMVTAPRSRWSIPHTLHTSGNLGQLIPVFCREVLPGDTLKCKDSKVIRLNTLLTPVMNSLLFETYYFFVPNRLVWNHWKAFNGENTQSPWIPQTEFSIPQLVSPASTGWTKGSIADYFGIPTGVPNLSVNALPFRALAMIINEWFRDENVNDPINFPVTDATVTGTNGSTYQSDIAKGGMPFIVSRKPDLFSKALPSPQKGPEVTLPLGGTAPVVTWAGANDPSIRPLPHSAMSFENTVTGTTWTHTTTNPIAVGVNRNGQASTGNSTALSGANVLLAPNNLVASLADATAASINQLRLAFAVQRYYEKLSRGGSRYTEIISALFNTKSPDARLQRPEYLGGSSLPLSVQQIVQQSESGTTPLGTTGAISLTTDVNNNYTFSATEHGYIIGVSCLRLNKHVYQQGLNRMWSRKTKFDFYLPPLANIGESAVLKKEIYCDGSASDEQVFGYQESWYDYRFTPDYVTGGLRSNLNNGLDIWHLADDYSSCPTLSDGWLREDKSLLDRALAVTSNVADQFIINMAFDEDVTRVMPVHSIPGLIDHN